MLSIMRATEPIALNEETPMLSGPDGPTRPSFRHVGNLKLCVFDDTNFTQPRMYTETIEQGEGFLIQRAAFKAARFISRDKITCLFLTSTRSVVDTQLLMIDRSDDEI